MIRLWALTIAAGAALLVAPLPVPPMVEPNRLWSWWVDAGPLVALFSVSRMVLLVMWMPWALLLVVGLLVRGGRTAGAVGRVAASWSRKRGIGALIRLALGASASGGVLAACSSSSSMTAMSVASASSPLSVTTSLPATTAPGGTGPPATLPAPQLAGPPPAPVLISPADPTSGPLTTDPPGSIATGPDGPTPTSPSTSPSVPTTGRPRGPVTTPTPSSHEPTGSGSASGRRPAASGSTRPLMSPGRRSAKPPLVPTAPPSTPAPTWTVRPGDDFWSIAEATVSAHGGGPVAGYWVRLIEANRSRLPDPDDPSLLFPGDVLVLPAPTT